MSTVGRLAAALFVFLGATFVAQSGTATLKGRVIGATGDPLRHARVSLTSGSGSIPAVLTDEEGRFSFTLLIGARYTLSAVKAGFAKTTRSVVVADGSAADAGDVVLSRAAVIAGFAVEETGEP